MATDRSRTQATEAGGSKENLKAEDPLLPFPAEGVANQGDEDPLEDQLTHEKLLRLEQIFDEADEDDGGGLDMEEFRHAMRLTMGDHVTDEELDMIFMKVDTNCDGTVDWDEYLTYMLLECREKDIMQAQAKQPFPREVKVVGGDNPRDSVIRILFIPNVIVPGQRDEANYKRLDMAHGRYAAASKDGFVNFYSAEFKLLSCRTVEPVPPHKKSVWVTDIAVMACAHMLVAGTTSRDIIFYDINGHRFEKLSHISNVPGCPVTMTFWSQKDPYLENKPWLIWGDDKGGISIIRFDDCPSESYLNRKRFKLAKERYKFDELLLGKVPGLNGGYMADVHGDTVQQVMYCHSLSCIVSCSKDPETAMFTGSADHRLLSAYFKVEKGINAFDYCAKLNVLVSGGYDAMVRVWNPYVTTQPVIILHGHKSPVEHVVINSVKEHVISIAENKEIRVHDLTTQTCIQTFFRKMLPDMGPRMVTAAMFQETRQALLFATTTLAVLQHKEEEVQQLHSHKNPVTIALYNPLFHQVVSACVESLVCVWNVYTGEKVMQFKAHKVRTNGRTMSVEVTAMTFDPTYRRLITASRGGSVKLWNFNNGSCLRELPLSGAAEITSIVCSATKQRIITAGWNKRLTIYVDQPDDDRMICLTPSHKDDILTMAYNSNNLVASGAYDGNILVWSLETRRCIFYTNIHGSGKARSKDVINALMRQSQNTENHSNNENAPTEPPPRSNIERVGISSDTSGGFAEQKTSVDKIIFLPERKSTRETATLFAACADGYVRAYSVHHEGGLRGTFKASITMEAVVSLTTSPENDLLVTADGKGYIRVWDVSHYLIEGLRCTPELDRSREPLWQKFPFYKLLPGIKAMCKTKDSIPKKGSHFLLNEQGGPHILSSVRAHLQLVTGLDFARINGSDFLLTCSVDHTVRLMTLYGQFLGIFGQPTIWTNIKAHQEPSSSPRPFHSRNTVLPPDIRRVASSTTLRVLNSGRPPRWLVRTHILMWLGNSTKKYIGSAPSFMTGKLEEESVNLETPATPTNITGEMLEKSTRRTRHRLLPPLRQVPAAPNQVKNRKLKLFYHYYFNS